MAGTLTLSLDWDLEERSPLYWTLFFLGVWLCIMGGVCFLFDDLTTGRMFYASSAVVLIACCLLRLYSTNWEKGIETLFCRLYSLSVTLFCLVPNPSLEQRIYKLVFIWLGLTMLLYYLCCRGAAEAIRQIGFQFFRSPHQSIFQYCLGCYKRKCFSKTAYGENSYSSWDPFYIALGLFALGHTFGGFVAWLTFLIGSILYVDSCARWLILEDRSSPEAWAWTICCVFLVPCFY